MRQILTRTQRRIAAYLRSLLTALLAPRLLTEAQLAMIPLARLRELAAQLDRRQIPLPPLGIGFRRLVAPDAVPSGGIPFGGGWLRITEHGGGLVVELSLAKRMTGALVVIAIRATPLGWRVTNVDTRRRTALHVLRLGSHDRVLDAATRASSIAFAAFAVLVFADAYWGLVSGCFCYSISAACYSVYIGPGTGRRAWLEKLALLTFLAVICLATVYFMVAYYESPVPAALISVLLGALAGWLSPRPLASLTSRRVARWWHDLRSSLHDRRWASRRRLRAIGLTLACVLMALALPLSINRVSGSYLYTRAHATQKGMHYTVERWVDERGEGFELRREINTGNATEEPLEGYVWTSADGVRPHQLSGDLGPLARELELPADMHPRSDAALRALELVATTATSPEQRSSVLTLLGRGPGVTRAGSPPQLLVPVNTERTPESITTQTLSIAAPGGVVRSYALSTEEGGVATVVTSWRLMERRENTTAP